MSCDIFFSKSEFTQKVFDLNKDFSIVLLAIRVENKIEIHVKLVDKLNNNEICMTEDLLVELVRESKSIWNIDIQYPCTSIFKRIQVTQEHGEYVIKYQQKKIVLPWDVILEIDNQLAYILKTLRQIEIDLYLKIHGIQ